MPVGFLLGTAHDGDADVAHRLVASFHRLQPLDPDTCCGQHRRSFWAADAYGGERPAGVRQLHIIHNDEVLQGFHDGCHLRLVGIQQQIFSPVVDVHVAQNASLGIEQEIVIAAILR